MLIRVLVVFLILNLLPEMSSATLRTKGCELRFSKAYRGKGYKRPEATPESKIVGQLKDTIVEKAEFHNLELTNEIFYFFIRNELLISPIHLHVFMRAIVEIIEENGTEVPNGPYQSSVSFKHLSRSKLRYFSQKDWFRVVDLMLDHLKNIILVESTQPNFLTSNERNPAKDWMPEQWGEQQRIRFKDFMSKEGADVIIKSVFFSMLPAVHDMGIRANFNNERDPISQGVIALKWMIGGGFAGGSVGLLFGLPILGFIPVMASGVISVEILRAFGITKRIRKFLIKRVRRHHEEHPGLAYLQFMDAQSQSITTDGSMSLTPLGTVNENLVGQSRIVERSNLVEHLEEFEEKMSSVEERVKGLGAMQAESTLRNSMIDPLIEEIGNLGSVYLAFNMAFPSLKAEINEVLSLRKVDTRNANVARLRVNAKIKSREFTLLLELIERYELILARSTHLLNSLQGHESDGSEESIQGSLAVIAEYQKSLSQMKDQIRVNRDTAVKVVEAFERFKAHGVEEFKDDLVEAVNSQIQSR